jgi:prepilin-type N-terminal cleavage/methylation domain-containing protein
MVVRTHRAFTLIELLVVISIIAILMAVLMPALKRAREGGKRAACLSNLKQLTLAWNMYADENDDRLVNGATGYSDYTGGDWATHAGELAWIDTLDNTNWDAQIAGIKRGALWPYLRNEDIYRCPTGRRGQALTYSIMFSMNAVCHTEVHGMAMERPCRSPMGMSITGSGSASIRFSMPDSRKMKVRVAIGRRRRKMASATFTRCSGAAGASWAIPPTTKDRGGTCWHAVGMPRRHGEFFRWRDAIGSFQRVLAVSMRIEPAQGFCLGRVPCCRWQEYLTEGGSWHA